MSWSTLRPMADHLELPRPLCLLRTVGWSVLESLGLPLAAYLVGAWLAGRNVGLVASVAVIWLTAIGRKVVSGSVPGLLVISAMVLTIQTVAAIATGDLWIFLLHFPMGNLALCVLFALGARGPNPLCAKLAAEVISLRHPGHLPGLNRFFQRVTLVWLASSCCWAPPWARCWPPSRCPGSWSCPPWPPWRCWPPGRWAARCGSASCCAGGIGLRFVPAA